MLNTIPEKAPEIRALFRRLGEIDWDFTAQSSDSPFSSVHWHPCRFPSQLPAIVIGRLCRPEGLVLDPFMGSATTLVEAQRLGRPSIGIDLNPVSCLMANAKTLALSAGEIGSVSDALRLKVLASWEATASSPLPAAVQGEKWYVPTTLSGLQKLWSIALKAESLSEKSLKEVERPPSA